MDPRAAQFIGDATIGFVSFVLGWLTKHLNDFLKK